MSGPLPPRVVTGAEVLEIMDIVLRDESAKTSDFGMHLMRGLVGQVHAWVAAVTAGETGPPPRVSSAGVAAAMAPKPTLKIRIFHFRRASDGSRSTLAVAVRKAEGDFEVILGRARCSAADTFDPVRGERIARARLMAHLDGPMGVRSSRPRVPNEEGDGGGHWISLRSSAAALTFGEDQNWLLAARECVAIYRRRAKTT